jgi:hypothetical protein
MPLNVRQIINAKLKMLTRPSKITHSPARREYPSLRAMAAILRLLPINRGDPTLGFASWQREKSRAWQSSAFVQRYPVINNSGRRIAFSVFEKDRRAVHVSAPDGAGNVV